LTFIIASCDTGYKYVDAKTNIRVWLDNMNHMSLSKCC